MIKIFDADSMNELERIMNEYFSNYKLDCLGQAIAINEMSYTIYKDDYGVTHFSAMVFFNKKMMW